MSAVGGLVYITMTTRPDIAYSVGVLSRFMACPINVRTKEYGITYSKQRQSQGLLAPHSCDAPVVYARYHPGKGVSESSSVDVKSSVSDSMYNDSIDGHKLC
jgi:hypothetical protein